MPFGVSVALSAVFRTGEGLEPVIIRPVAGSWTLQTLPRVFSTHCILCHWPIRGTRSKKD